MRKVKHEIEKESIKAGSQPTDWTGDWMAMDSVVDEFQ